LDVDIILVKMEKDSEDFCRRLIELAMEYGYTTQEEIYKTNNIFVGDLVIIPSKRQVLVNDKEVFFTSKEFDILELLAANRGQVFSKGQIYDRVWEACYVADDRNITAYINKIRKKIEPDQSRPIYIQTVWGVGYKFNEKIK